MAFFTTQRKETGSYNTKRTKPCRSRRKGKIYNEKTKRQTNRLGCLRAGNFGYTECAQMG